MTLEQFRERINILKNTGYIETHRAGNTGVGQTLEQELGLIENNIASPDLGNIELKAQRKNVSNKVTIFTFNRGVWKIKQKLLIEKYGYIDTTNRRALYCAVSNEPNPQGLYLSITGDRLGLYHKDEIFIAEWKIEGLIDTFNTKMPDLIIVIADSRINSKGREEFWYNESYFLKGANKDMFLRYIQKGIIIVDIRMHLKENGTVRNHGTAFRMDEQYISDCFESKSNLIE
jgi:hypothetical protein